MKISVSVVEGKNLADRWRDDAARCDRITQDALDDIGTAFVRTAQQLAPGDGAYSQSFSSQPSGSAVEAGSDSPMAALIEKGRRPGRRPSPQSIRKRSGGSYAAAARAADRIAAQGTRGRFTVKRANAAIKKDGTIDRIARRALKRIVEGGNGVD